MGSSSKWQEQWDRVERWYQRFTMIDQGREHNLSSDYYQDEVYAFFINCYHLKDWIKNDSSVGSAGANVEDFINRNNQLSLCADICNGIKHLTLLKERERSHQGPQFGCRVFKLQVGGSPIISAKYTVDTSAGPADAFDLATKCLEAWKQFILSNITHQATT